MSSLNNTLIKIKEKSKNDTELGNAFEQLSKVFFEYDDTQIQQYSKVWHYKDWAKDHQSYSKNDIGIDLVAKLREEEGYCAIQCKFYNPDHSISKTDIDSFISASASTNFKRLILIDTSNKPIGKNAQSVLDNLEQEYVRIQKSELDNSRIDWSTFINEGNIQLRSKKELRDHQIKALNSVKEGLKDNDRGKIIMACGTGKTFTSLRIAEEIAGPHKKVLYMVPSLALMSQTVREWKNDAHQDFVAFSACSDEKVGKIKNSEDSISVSLNDLAFPATTNPEKLSEKIKQTDQSKMIVVFSTYHSIDVISKAQFDYGLDDFDLIICDEAHRTTGARLVGEDESNFIKIHSNENIRGKKRLYMTATPRIYGEKARRKEEEGAVQLASMDNEEIYGKNLFYRGFGWAVENGLLTDYKVVVLMMDEQQVSDRIQREFTDGSELKLDDATKMIGCYKALGKIGLQSKDVVETKNNPMKKAIAFCQNIKSSEMFSAEFANVVREYISNEEVSAEFKTDLEVELFHVDGSFNAEQRNEKLDWLKETTDENICRVLTNARCLSEGVDVPALDAIMFLHPRKSQIDVVQSVGRVMRKSKGKDLGYVILPITVAPGVKAEKALNDNKRYEVVWQILNALRAHDERFDSTINKIGLGEDVSDRLEIIDGSSYSEMESTTAVVEDVRTKPKNKDESEKSDETNISEESSDNEKDIQLSFSLTDLSQAIQAKIVEKCGTRDYWENWAKDIAKIAQQHIIRINSIVLNSGTPEREAFINFLEEIRDDLNPEISEMDAVEMLAQHIITRPVFDALFQGNRFTSENAFSRAMEEVLSKIYNRNIDTETRTLERFYKSVERRAADIVTLKGKQTLILELYDRFFRNAFPLMARKLGIVYTPIEVVDFIINSVEDVMNDEFKTTLGSEGVHILDPFSGTGTFVSRLLQSGILNHSQIRQKYKKEIHANEIVLLAYYIACINIEAVYDNEVKADKYESFPGMVFTDTFQLYEQERDMIANLLPDNSERRTKQKEQKINVIIGNPPYSAGQTSANDNAANMTYPNLDRTIEKSYAAVSTATNKNSLYDSYIRAFRWASDRINDKGVIGFVTNAGWVDGNATDGFRKCLCNEFSKIYIFHLRGNQRTQGERSRQEGGKIFGSGSRAPIAITILVKDKSSTQKGRIFFNDIGDYLNREEKLAKIQKLKSINGIKKTKKFNELFPDEKNDWINQGSKSFYKFIKIGEKKESGGNVVFDLYSNGLKTNCDFWLYNSSKIRLEKNMKRLVEFYNSEVQRYIESGKKEKIENFVDKDPTKISWHSGIFPKASRGEKTTFEKNDIWTGLYRPFTKRNVYANKHFVQRMAQLPKIFTNNDQKNLVICVTGLGTTSGFSCLMTDIIPDLNLVSNCQCFPLKVFENDSDNFGELFKFSKTNKTSERFGITDEFSKMFNKHNDLEISKTDIFYYIYGILHSSDYRRVFNNNLTKELPRIPLSKDFQEFIDAGKKLGYLHTKFEELEPFSLDIDFTSDIPNDLEARKNFFRVEKMRFKDKLDKSILIYNKNIIVKNIPLDAYEYMISGKSAIDWIIERQSVKIDKASGILNDANDFANENMNNPAYPLELLKKVITVSLETIKIVKALPKLNFQ